MMLTNNQDLQTQPLDLKAETDEMDALYQQLDTIFGTPKQQLTEALESLYAELDAIQGTPKELTEEEQLQVDALNAQVDALFDGNEDENGEWVELTESQEAELNNLFDQIDQIYGLVAYNDLTAEQQSQVDSIYGQIDTIEFGDEGDWDNDDNLADSSVIDENTQVLLDELDGIFGTPKSDLTEEEQTQIDTLNAQADAILAPDANGEWADLTEAQETELNGLYDQIDAIYGLTPYSSLPEAQQQRADEILEQLESESMFADQPDDDGEDFGDWDDMADWGDDSDSNDSDSDDSWANFSDWDDDSDSDDDSWANFSDWGDDSDSNDIAEEDVVPSTSNQPNSDNSDNSDPWAVLFSDDSDSFDFSHWDNKPASNNNDSWMDMDYGMSDMYAYDSQGQNNDQAELTGWNDFDFDAFF